MAHVEVQEERVGCPSLSTLDNNNVARPTGGWKDARYFYGMLFFLQYVPDGMIQACVSRSPLLFYFENGKLAVVFESFIFTVLPS